MNHQYRVTWAQNRILYLVNNLYADNRSSKGLTPAINLATRVGMLIGLFLVLGWELRHTALLPIASYFQAIITIELVRHLVSSLGTMFIALVLVAVGAVRFRSTLCRWNALEYGNQLRIFVGLLVAVSAWTYSTYDFNLYYNQPHYFDRLLLLVLTLGIFWKPVFVLPFTIVLISIINQFNFPISGQVSMWTEMNLLWQVLLLFSAMFIVYLATGSRKTTDFIYVVCCLLAASYLRSGIGKLSLNWISFPHIDFLMLGGYSSGWLSFLLPETIVSIVQFMSKFALPMMLVALVVEWGNLLIMWRPRSTLFFLTLFPLFHLAVFAISGIFFWKWIVLELSLLLLFYGIRKLPAPAIYTPWHFALSLVLIVGGVNLFATSNMSWYDSRLQYSYRYEAVTESGRHYDLPSNVFAPYVHTFTFEFFPFLSKETQLTGAYGVTITRDTADALLAATTAEQIYALEKRTPSNAYDEKLAAEYDDFITTFVDNLNKHKGNPTWWKIIQPPAHLWSIPRPGEMWPDGEDPIIEIIVREVTSFYDNQKLSVIRERVIRDILEPQ